MAALRELDEQERGPVRPPVGRLDEAVQLEAQLHDVPGPGVPDGGPALALALVADGHALIAGDRRPREGCEIEALVAELSDGRPRARVDDAQRLVQQVAVLGVLDADERLVRGQPGLLDAACGDARRPGEADRFGVTMEQPRGGAKARRLGDPDREAVHPADRRDRALPAEGEALVPARWEALERVGLGTAHRQPTLERGAHEPARLVAGEVAEPDDTRPVSADVAAEHAHGLIGDAPAGPRGEIP